MKKVLTSYLLSLCLLGVSSLEAAYDHCVTSCDPCDFDECVSPFEGFYLGGNVGVLSHFAFRTDNDGFLTDNSGWSTISTNVAAGGQLGYDWLCCNTLFGIVVDGNWANNENTLNDDPNGDNRGNRIKNEYNWFLTIRGRTGLNFSNTLMYFTAGAAAAGLDVEWRNAPDTLSYGNTRWGWTGGLGTEFNWFCKWNVGAELLFLSFSNKNETLASSNGTLFTFGNSDSAWLFRVFLNYRFGDLCGLFSWCR